MVAHGRRRDRVLALAVALLVLAAGAPAYGQMFDDPFAPDPPPTTTTSTPSTTTTTEAPAEDSPLPTTPGSTTTTTAPPREDGAPAPAEGDATPPGEQTPPPSDDVPPPDGEGGTGTPGGIPPAAQAVIDSIQRSPANSSRPLYEAVQQLVDLGLSEEEAIRIGFGRFPIAGVATFVHDWYFPRWGPGFRFHMGTDVFATYGTPVRSPVDGTATAGNGGLGGLYVKVFQPDGSYFYLAHLSGLVDGFANDMPVKTGDIVGYVGDSGNAKGGSPHVHLGIYSAAGEATDPKPILDQMLADAMAALPGIVDHVRSRVAVDPSEAPAPAPRVPRSLLATSLLRPLVDARTAGVVDTARLFEAVGNPSSGGLAVVQAEASALAASIDWSSREAEARNRELLAERAEALIRSALGPLG